MKVDNQPFPQANVVELSDFRPEGQNLAFQINMAGPMRRRDEQRKEAVSGKRPHDEDEPEQQYVTEEQVRHIRNQLPASNRLLEKYQYQYKLRRRYESEEEEYEHRTGRTLGRRQAIRDHWHCSFFRYCWNSGMSRLPTIDDCLECRPRGRQSGKTSVFRLLGPKARHDDHVERPSRDDLELEGEDKYHRPRWCPDGLSRSQKHRVQRLRNLEEAEARYLDVLSKTRPNLAGQVRRPQSGKAPSKERVASQAFKSR